MTHRHGPGRGAIPRRRFVQGAALAGAALAVPARALRAAPGSGVPAMLSGPDFDLAIVRTPVNITGRQAMATGVNDSVPGPILRWREGETVTLNVSNHLRVPTSIHWHGIRSPAGMDGVPALSFAGIMPGETFSYRIPLRQSGTYWYHSHSGFQEQTGLYGAIIVEPRGGYAQPFDREYVVLLSDWSDTDPDEIVSNLKMQSDYYDFHQRTVGTFVADARRDGLRSAVDDRLAWGRMRMSPTDIADVSASAYTYVLNGQPPGANWTGLFRPGERVRLRFINGASMTFFDVRIPGLTMTVVSADGNDVEPVAVDEFRIGVAETYDVIVQPTADAAYTIFAQSEDRTGYARGTLATRAGMAAAIPPMDPRPMRSMTDMGMSGMAMGGMKMDGEKAAGAGAKMSGMDMPGAGKGGMDMDGMSMGSDPMPGMPAKGQGSMAGMAGIDGMTPEKSGTGHLGTTRPGRPGMSGTEGDPVGARLDGTVNVDNVAMTPIDRLSEPGDGLQNNGRRVLTYADLRATRPGADPRPPSREITLRLTGNMNRYIWGFDGKKFSQAEPIRLKLGERVRFTLINDTMMEHPIHLHGLWSELENGQGEYRPYKHTIIVKPGEKLSYLVTADEAGMWAYHCHLLYHMEMGMFRTVVVA
jgi:CopA family copper-resistance protein